MALVLKDRVKETSTTAGTGTITLAGAVAGFQSFSAVGNGNTTYYAIVDPTTGDWEVGIGTYTSSGTTLSRDTVLSSSNSGSLVSFTSNPKDVFVTYPSEKSVYEDASNVVNATSFGAITATSAALTTGTVSTTPASNTDIANKQYVDGLVSSGITYHTPVKYEVPDTTGNLTATYNNGASGVGATLTNAGTLVAFTPDGTVATAGDRILVYNQTNQFENGVYTVTTVGSGSVAWVLTRATDADTYALKSPNGLGNGDAFFITSGATGAGETYVCNTAGVITFGTTAITFAQISDSTLYTAGTGLTLSGTQFSITNTAVTAATYGSASAVPVFAVNAQGQITGVTDTNIAINGSQVSGNISGSAGSVANALTLGTYLTGGTYNGSAAVTATVDATSANTASKVVARDSSGNFSAGTITATLNGTATSTASATNLSGGAANQIAYQSATNTTAFATAPSASNQVLNWNGSAFTWSTGTISGVPLGSNLNSLTAGTYLTGTAYNGSAAQTWTVDATSANTASKVVARDASGNFSAGTITAALVGNVTGNASTATTATNLSGGTINGLTLNQERSTNARLYSAASGAMGLLGVDSTGAYKWQIYGDGSTYGFLDSTWGNWDTRKAVNGNMFLRVSSTEYTVLHSGNYNSYAPTLTGTGASGTWNISITGSAGSAPGYLPLSGGTMTGTIVSTTNSIVIGQLSGATYGYLYQDGSGFGLLTYNGSWAVRVDYGTNSVYIPGIGYSASSLRAPIFYDSDDTNYYVNPSSTSSFYSGFTFAVSNPTISAPSYIIFPGGAYFNSGTVYMEANIKARGGVGDDTNTALTLTGGTGGWTQINGSARSPIFYDSNNTSYYLDPASRSVISTLNIGSSTTIASGALSIYAGGASSVGWGTGLNIGDSSNYMSFIQDGGVNRFRNYGTGGWDWYSSGGSRRYWGDDSGNSYAGTSFRSPIFYDSDDTGYYVNPNSSSYLYSLILSGAAYFRPNSWIQFDGDYGIYSTAYNSAHFLANASSSYGAWRTIGSRNNYSGIYDTYSGVNLGMFDSAGNGGFYREANGRWYQYHNVSNNCTGFGASTTASGYNIYCGTGIYSGGRVDGTIFYDANNTGYYTDPASTSRMSSIMFDGSGSIFSASVGTAYTAAVCMREAPGGSGNTSTIYAPRLGFHWGGVVASSIMVETSGRIAIMDNPGTGYEDFIADISYASASSRAPIFYDSDNTGYYVDPNGTSNLNTLTISGYSSAGSAININWPHAGYINFWGATGQTLNINNASGYQVNLVVSGNVTAYSDERRKHDWQDVAENYVQRLAAVRSGTYMRSDGGSDERQAGVGAQSFSTLLPEVVSADENGYLSLAYGNAALVSAVELAKYVTALEQRISQLEARI